MNQPREFRDDCMLYRNGLRTGRVEYKFVKLQLDGARSRAWEARLVNRVIDIGCEDITMYVFGGGLRCFRERCEENGPMTKLTVSRVCVCRHASVSQSSVLGDHVPFLALNNSNLSAFASTLPESTPWWQVVCALLRFAGALHPYRLHVTVAGVPSPNRNIFRLHRSKTGNCGQGAVA
jgi:hypothetical protein